MLQMVSYKMGNFIIKLKKNNTLLVKKGKITLKNGRTLLAIAPSGLEKNLIFIHHQDEGPKGTTFE